jgi:hypothetical protein
VAAGAPQNQEPQAPRRWERKRLGPRQAVATAALSAAAPAKRSMLLTDIPPSFEIKVIGSEWRRCSTRRNATSNANYGRRDASAIVGFASGMAATITSLRLRTPTVTSIL